MNAIRRRLVDLIDIVGMGNCSKLGQWAHQFGTWLEPK